jgi:hypothetical protein
MTKVLRPIDCACRVCKVHSGFPCVDVHDRGLTFYHSVRVDEAFKSAMRAIDELVARLEPADAEGNAA